MTSSIDQQFVEYVVKSLVGNPDAVQVERRIDEKGVLLELTVDPEDLGRVIGKRGATAQSLRTLLRALGTKNEARYNLKIIDNGVAQDATDDTFASDDDASLASDLPAPAPVAAVSAAPAVDEDGLPTRATEDDSDRMARHRRELADLDDLDV